MIALPVEVHVESVGAHISDAYGAILPRSPLLLESSLKVLGVDEETRLHGELCRGRTVKDVREEDRMTGEAAMGRFLNGRFNFYNYLLVGLMVQLNSVWSLIKVRLVPSPQSVVFRHRVWLEVSLACRYGGMVMW